jgi:tetratricopeptide (TPR) repeat protein
VAELLSESNRLLDEGDWDAAHERLLKASALAESDGRVLSALARLEALRTDLVWLELKLLEPDARDALATRRRELDRRLVRTAQATDAALTEVPKDLVALRAQIDWLRMKGDTETARKRLGPLSEKSSDPANAYVLAALDLAEDSPAWPNVIDRLRLASSVEPGGGRAQAALVYALARAGKAPEADSEIAKIGTNSPVFTLVPALKAFVAKNSRRTAPAPTAARPAVNASPAQAAPARVAVADYRPLLAQARVAANNGQYSVAEELYQRVLELRPTNIEALAALGDIARKRKDPARAQELYQRALAQDPGYKPAIRGSARLAEDVEARKAPSPVIPPEARSAAFPPSPSANSPSADPPPSAPSAAPGPTAPDLPDRPALQNSDPAELK